MKKQTPYHFYNDTVDEFFEGFEARPINAIKSLAGPRVRDAVSYCKEEYLNMRNVGEGTYAAIFVAITAKGLLMAELKTEDLKGKRQGVYAVLSSPRTIHVTRYRLETLAELAWKRHFQTKEKGLKLKYKAWFTDSYDHMSDHLHIEIVWAR